MIWQFQEIVTKVHNEAAARTYENAEPETASADWSP